MLVSKMLIIEYNIQMLFQKLVSIENLASKSGDFLTKPTSISFVSNFVGWLEEDIWFHGFSIQETAVLMLRILWWVQNPLSFGAKIACWNYNHYYVAIYVKEPVAKVLFKDILISNQVLIRKYYYLYGIRLDQFTNNSN